MHAFCHAFGLFPLDLQFFNGKGELIEEVLGGSQERAHADAITVANEIKAFADLSGVSPPYADALARQKVIAVGAPYMSKSWFQARRPYEWSWFADCNTLVDMSTSYYIARLAGRPANLAGGALKGQPRRMALVAPDSDWFQDCVAAGPERVRAAGFAGEAQDDAFTYRVYADPDGRGGRGVLTRRTWGSYRSRSACRVQSVAAGCLPAAGPASWPYSWRVWIHRDATAICPERPSQPARARAVR